MMFEWNLATHDALCTRLTSRVKAPRGLGRCKNDFKENASYMDHIVYFLGFLSSLLTCYIFQMYIMINKSFLVDWATSTLFGNIG